MIPLILSGGSGTRLWPLSRPAQPKQFLRLLGRNSLFQETVQRVGQIRGRVAAPLVVCNQEHRFLVAEQLRELQTEVGAIVLEPTGRNTAPAVAVAALLAQESARGEEPVLAVFPADHVIGDTGAFVAAMEDALAAAAQRRLVTFGIVPNRPETGYGYIERGDKRARWFDLAAFIEKPKLATAKRYLASGKYLWNSGMFAFGVDTFLDELARHAPNVLEAARRALAGARRDEHFTWLGADFRDCPSISIDYAVMEKTDSAVVVPLDAGWNDVGSWSALHDVLGKDDAGNAQHGHALLARCSNSYVYAGGRFVAALGLNDIAVIETDDAVLVMTLDEAQNVKQVVDALTRASSKPR